MHLPHTHPLTSRYSKKNKNYKRIRNWQNWQNCHNWRNWQNCRNWRNCRNWQNWQNWQRKKKRASPLTLTNRLRVVTLTNHKVIRYPTCYLLSSRKKIKKKKNSRRRRRGNWGRRRRMKIRTINHKYIKYYLWLIVLITHKYYTLETTSNITLISPISSPNYRKIILFIILFHLDFIK